MRATGENLRSIGAARAWEQSVRSRRGFNVHLASMAALLTLPALAVPQSVGLVVVDVVAVARATGPAS